MSAPEAYIPNARDATVGYGGRTTWGAFRTYCVCCNDTAPLANAERIHGGREGEVDGECDMCRTTFTDLSARCQAEHDEQQAKWARESRVEYVIEMGCTAMIRCRVY